MVFSILSLFSCTEKEVKTKELQKKQPANRKSFTRLSCALKQK